MIFGPDGNLYVASFASSAVLRFSGSTGAPLPASGQSGATFVPALSGGLSEPAGLAFGPDGNLYVTSWDSIDVLRFSGSTGAPLPASGQSGATFVPARSGGLSVPFGLTFGPDHNLYVGTEDTNAVLRFNGSTGAVDPASGQSGATFVPANSGGLNDAFALLFGPDHNLYVASFFSNSVLRFNGSTGAVDPASGQAAPPSYPAAAAGWATPRACSSACSADPSAAPPARPPARTRPPPPPP